MRWSSRWLLPALAALPLSVAVSAPAPKVTGPQPFDWPQWRGPNRDDVGRETGLLAEWPSDGPPRAWTRKGLGGGFSTPSVAAGRVFGMGVKGTDEVVWALDEATGEPLWSTRIAAYANGKGGGFEGPRCTPTADGDLLYAVGISGDLVCLESATGKERWHKNYGKDFGGRMMSGWGFSESPLVDGDLVICTPGADAAALAALDKKTGAVRWKAAVPGGGGAGYASVMPAEAGGVKQYVNWLKNFLVGVSAKDGKFLWKYEKAHNTTANIPTVVVRGDNVFCSTGYKDGGSALLKLVPSGNGVKAEEVYYHNARELQNHHGGMVLIGDYLYGGHGHNSGAPVCVEFATGKVVWKQDRGPGSGSAAVTYADGRLYFRYQNGVMALIDATPAGYRLVSKFQLPEDSSKPSWPHPVIANGKLYVRDQDVLMCFDVKAKKA
jgi:outer membrane protein assembly factor BamB